MTDAVVTDERLREQGWVRVWDDEQQYHYYCNESTGESYIYNHYAVLRCAQLLLFFM